MISFKTLFISALAASLVTAAPAKSGDEPDGPSTAAYELITVCNNSNLSGNCVISAGNVGDCIGLGDYNDAVSSCKPNPNMNCWLFEHADCQGRQLYVPGPAYNLQEQNFNDLASSFRCYFK